MESPPTFANNPQPPPEHRKRPRRRKGDEDDGNTVVFAYINGIGFNFLLVLGVICVGVYAAALLRTINVPALKSIPFFNQARSTPPN